MNKVGEQSIGIASGKRIGFWLLLLIVVTGACCMSSIAEVVVDLKVESLYEGRQSQKVFDAEFGSISSLDDHHLVMIETGYTGRIDGAVTISQITEASRKVLWRGQKLSSLTSRILVGNIDGDEFDEVIAYRAEMDIYDSTGLDRSRVIEFQDGHYREVVHNNIAGRYGALIDIDNDGKSEVAMIVDRIVEPTGGEGRPPSSIRLYSYSDEQFSLIAEFNIGHTIQCIATGDVDADGSPEIVTQEMSNDGSILHQISVYEVATDGEISHTFSKNRALSFSWYSSRMREMRVFTDNDSNTYISAYKYRAPRSEILRWNPDRSPDTPLRGDDMLLRVYIENGIEGIKEIEADFELRTEAVRHRLPTDGKSYAQIEDRGPQLILWESAELGKVVLENDRR